MSKPQGLRRFFQNARKTVPVKLGSKIMQFTATQAIRLGELADIRRDTGKHQVILDRSNYSLEDAAMRLLLSEDEVIGKAIRHELSLYVSIADVPGQWMCRTESGEVLKAQEQTCISGYLALIDKDLRALATYGVCGVHILELRIPPDPESLAIPKSVTSALAAWGTATKVFRLSEVMQVDRSKIRLMPPLADEQSH